MHLEQRFFPNYKPAEEYKTFLDVKSADLAFKISAMTFLVEE